MRLCPPKSRNHGKSNSRRTFTAKVQRLTVSRFSVLPARGLGSNVLYPLLVLLSVFGLSRSPVAGDIVGYVRAEGKPGTEAATGHGSYDSRELKFAERVNYGEMHDFIVYIEGKVGTNSPAPSTAEVTTTRVSQKGATFVPHILPIVVGTTMTFFTMFFPSPSPASLTSGFTKALMRRKR